MLADGASLLPPRGLVPTKHPPAPLPMSIADRERYARDKERIRARQTKARQEHGSKWNATRKLKYSTNASDQTRAIWRTMIARCTDPEHDSYGYYGEKGVAVFPLWIVSYEAFVCHVGLRPKGLWLNRIDGTKGYEPGNVEWATVSDQMKNRTFNPCKCGTCKQCLHKSKSAARLREKRANG